MGVWSGWVVPTLLPRLLAPILSNVEITFVKLAIVSPFQKCTSGPRSGVASSMGSGPQGGVHHHDQRESSPAPNEAEATGRSGIKRSESRTARCTSQRERNKGG